MNSTDDILRQAELRPSHPAVIEYIAPGDRRITTYAELASSIRRRAAEFTARGIEPGQRCGLLARQGLEFIESALAIMAAGGCVAPLPVDSSANELQDVRDKCQLHHLWHANTGILDSFTGVGAIDGDDDRQFKRFEPAYMRFTSGTTSVSKGVLIGHAAVVARTDAANAALQVGPCDRVFWVLPMVHHFVVSIMLYLRKGATVVLPGNSLPQTMLEVIREEQATLLYASPYHYQQLSRLTAPGKLDSVRLAVSTTTGLTEQIASQFAARWDLPLCQALGVIEVGLPVMNIEFARQLPLSLGRPLPSYEVWLRGEDGERVVSDGTRETCGEICIRGPGVFDAYLNPWRPSQDTLAQDGFRTGDMGWFDEHGNLTMLGRHKNRISVAGMKFFAEEVEAVLARHPDIALSRVFSSTHERLGEIPVADVVLRPGSTLAADGVAHFCRKWLSHYKVPREIKVVEQLDFTATGKVKRWG